MKHGIAMGARTAFRDTAEHAAAIVSVLDANAFNARPFPPPIFRTGTGHRVVFFWP